MKTELARAGLIGVLGVASIEWIASASAYQDRLDDADWAAVTQARDGAGDRHLIIANRWLDPIARSRLPAAALIDTLARPDLRGLSTFDVLGSGRTVWSEELQADLEDLAHPQPVLRTDLGDLTLTTYAFDHVDEVVADFTGAAKLRVESPSGACRGRGPWKCKEGAVELRVVEIDYRPRRCLVSDVADGVPVRITMPAASTGTRLRGHVGFSDFNGRLRSDAPAEFNVEVSGTTLARWVVSDEQGWHPFAVATDTGVGDITVELRTATRGTWSGSGYAASAPRPVCFELRAFDEVEG
jgi:hypothetical protein